ncbi:DUF3618 domain-containing protein [Agromyces sp. MMS24-JH15]|uniref:DUF3618 domain-containing protein n=1 Tax=Agromyces sp. MMS24-JH15 TaxID=3243765 RepID=UPI00374835DE
MSITDLTPGGSKSSRRDAAARERNLTRLQARLNVEQARGDFAATLNALEDRLNVPKRVARATDRAEARVRRFAKEHPIAAGAVAVGAVAAIGGLVWLAVRNASKS